MEAATTLWTNIVASSSSRARSIPKTVPTNKIQTVPRIMAYLRRISDSFTEGEEKSMPERKVADDANGAGAFDDIDPD